MGENSDLHLLKRLDARAVWNHEALDFTPWLREHIEELNQAIGLEIEIVGQEQAVGAFAVDLFGHDVQTGQPVIIENQLAPTDHTHLGQLLTYASGLGAKTILWVSPQFRDEHRQAMDWLNEITPEDVGFFGVELEILEINGQRAANFKLVARPNAWQKTASGTKSAEVGGTSPRMLRYQAFFADLLTGLKAQSPSATTATKTQPENWFQFSAAGGAYFAWSFTWDGRFKVELTVDTTDDARNREVMHQLQQQAQGLADMLPEPLEWDLSDTRRAQRVAVFASKSARITDTDAELDALKPWAIERMVQWVDYWRPRVRIILG